MDEVIDPRARGMGCYSPGCGLGTEWVKLLTSTENSFVTIPWPASDGRGDASEDRGGA